VEHPEMQVSHETIYQALYVQGRESLRLEVWGGAAVRTDASVTSEAGGSALSGSQDGDNLWPGRAEVENRAVPCPWKGT
jgi:IS30 family transposase